MASEEERLHPLILESIGEAVFTVDHDLRVTSFNRAAEGLTGLSRDEAVGMRCRDVFRADICQDRCALRRTVETGERQRDVRATILDREMQEVPVTFSTNVLLGDEGEVVGGVEVIRDISELESLRRALRGEHVFEDIVGVSPAMRRLFGILPDVAQAEVPVLIEGPSGTGKEMVAQAIHRLSPRAGGPYVAVNCGALPDTLLESELFGHRRGAFTDARRDHPGRFVVADGGTLLLDEIGETTPAFQVRLLRALESGEIHPLGAEAPINVDVRVLAATNRDLARMVEEGTFREDLFYRLRVVALRLPALAERPEDIPPLVEHLLQRIALKRGREVRGVAPDAMRALSSYSYPGNVRELENVLERALVLCHGDVIGLWHLPPEVTVRGIHAPAPRVDSLPSARAPRVFEPPLEELAVGLPPEGRRILEALKEARWHRARAADALGVSRTTLWRRMKRFGLA